MRRVARDRSGATMIEFTLVFSLLLVVTFGIAEFSWAFFQWNSAEKATAMGARVAVTTDAVANGFEELDCGLTAIPAGTVLGVPCSSTGQSFAPIVCWSSSTSPDANPPSGSCQQGSGSYSFDGAAFRRIYTAMRSVDRDLIPNQVAVTYSDIGMGFVGRGGPVPLVTVSIRQRSFRWILIGALLGLDTVPMPPFTTSLTGEDLRNGLP